MTRQDTGAGHGRGLFGSIGTAGGRASACFAAGLAACLVAGAGTPAAAAPAGSGGFQAEDGDTAVRPRLIAEHAGLIAGQTNTIAVTLELAEGWHVYWPGQNDSGYPVGVDLDLPKKFEAGEMLWPAPERYTLPGDILDHVYHDRATLLIPIDVPAKAKPGSTVEITAALDWLVCREACVPGGGEVSASFEVLAADETPAPSPDRAFIMAARDRLPEPLHAGQRDFTISWSGSELRIAPERRFEKLEFYPFESSAEVESLIASGVAERGGLRLRAPKASSTTPISGVLAAFEPDGDADREAGARTRERVRFYEVSLSPGSVASATLGGTD